MAAGHLQDEGQEQGGPHPDIQETQCSGVIAVTEYKSRNRAVLNYRCMCQKQAYYCQN